MIFDMEHLDKLRDKSLSVIHFGTFYVVLPWLGSSCNTLYGTGVFSSFELVAYFWGQLS